MTDLTAASEALLADLTPDPDKPLLYRGDRSLGDLSVRLRAIEAEAAQRERARLTFDTGDTGECGWVCPFGKGAHPATSTHHFVPRGACRCGHRGDQHPGDGGCVSQRGCDCDGHTIAAMEADRG